MLISEAKRVVLDTSVIVSGIMAKQKNDKESPPWKILRWLEGSYYILEGNGKILEEYQRVLDQKANERVLLSQHVNYYLTLIRNRGLFNSPAYSRPPIYVTRDPSDGIYFSSPNCLNAHYLVTSNHKHFAEIQEDLVKLGSPLKIVSPTEFITQIRA